jgi:hypothetical protein
MVDMATGNQMLSDLHSKPHRRHGSPNSWSPLLVLGASVVASVALIGACMAMIAPDAQLPAAPATLAASR